MDKGKDIRAKRRGGRRGLSSLELVLAIAILALACIPVLDVFTGSCRAVHRSGVAFQCQHVARELLEELRHTPYEGLTALAHEWKPVTGSALALTKLHASADGADATMNYPPEYEKIETRLVLEPLVGPKGPDPDMIKAVVELRWQEKGSATN